VFSVDIVISALNRSEKTYFRSSIGQVSYVFIVFGVIRKVRFAITERNIVGVGILRIFIRVMVSIGGVLCLIQMPLKRLEDE
jgi:hypothetical protein